MPVNELLINYSKKTGAQLKEMNKYCIFENGGLSKLIEQVDLIKRSKDGKIELIIPRDKPLIIQNPDHEIITNIDITCKIEGKITENNDIDFSKYSMEVNLWSNNPDFCYRKELDSDHIGEKVNLGVESGENFKRILLRFHFDMRDEKTKIAEPLFHFHIGGENVDNNCYMWMPKELSEPRIPYPPMDPLMLIDLVLRNFCFRSSQPIIDRPTWTDQIGKCHDLFQKNYDHYSLHKSLFSA